MIISSNRERIIFKKVINILILVNLHILDARQNHKLSLRKKKIDEIISRRRENNIIQSEKKDFEIDPVTLDIPQDIYDRVFIDYKDFYSFTRNLLTSCEINKIYYGIYLIRTQSIKDKYIHTEYIFENKIIDSMQVVLVQNLENQKIVVSEYYYLKCIFIIPLI